MNHKNINFQYQIIHRFIWFKIFYYFHLKGYKNKENKNPISIQALKSRRIEVLFAPIEVEENFNLILKGLQNIIAKFSFF